MKKRLILTVLLVVMTVVLTAIPAHAESYMRGDADSNGIVSILDVTRIQRWLALLEDVIGESAADADEDGAVTIFDATQIQRYLAGYKNVHRIGKTFSGEMPTEAYELPYVPKK